MYIAEQTVLYMPLHRFFWWKTGRQGIVTGRKTGVAVEADRPFGLPDVLRTSGGDGEIQPEKFVEKRVGAG